MKQIKNYIIVALVLGLLFLLTLRKCSSSRLNQVLIENSVLKDSISTVTNKDSSTTTKIASLAITNKKQLLNIDSKNKEILKLQKKLKNSKKVITSSSFSTTTEAKTVSPTIVINRDTIIINDTVYVYPEYKSFFVSKGNWVKIHTIANKDSIFCAPIIENSFTVTLKEEGKWFKKKKVYAEVVSENPFNKVKSLRAVNLVNARKRRLNIKLRPSVAVGIDFKGNFRTVAGPALILDWGKK